MENNSFGQRFKTRWIQFWGIIFFCGVSINFIEIVCRTCFGFSWDLMYDLPVWLTIWSVMMLAGPILPDGDHVSVDMVRDKLTGTPRKVLESINMLMCIIFGAIVTYGGAIVVKQYYQYNMKIIRVIPVPRWMVEIAVPLGMLMFTIFAVLQLIKIMRTNYNEIKKETDEYTS